MRLRHDTGEPTTLAYGLGGLAVVFVIWLLGCLLFMWPFVKVNQDEIGLSYGGGMFEGQTFQGVVEPGTGFEFNGWGDALYKYPTTQRTYIISEKEGEGDDKDSVRAVSEEEVCVRFEVAVYFTLNTDKIRAFHEDIGLKYDAWTDGGWDDMLTENFRQVIESSLQEEARTYPVIDLYSNEEALVRIQTDVGTQLKRRIEEVIGADYFCGPTFEPGGTCGNFSFVVKRVVLPEDIVTAFERNRTSEIAVLTKQNEIDQAVAEAESIRIINDALATAGPEYTLLEAIKSGDIQFWVIPNDQGLTLPTPAP